jgi:hypothetical protein
MVRGTEVVVSHYLGNEQGYIAGIINEVVAGEGRRYIVRFNDGTESTWSERVVKPVA